MYILNSGCRIGRPRNLQVHVECTISRGTLKPLLRQLKTRATGITGEGRRKDIPLKVTGKVSTLPLRLRPRKLIEKRSIVSLRFSRSMRDSQSLVNRRFHVKINFDHHPIFPNLIFSPQIRSNCFFFLSTTDIILINSDFKPILFKPNWQRFHFDSFD